MRLFVATEHHFVRGPDCRVYSESGGREYEFWSRYLPVFDEVHVVGRMRDAPVEPTGRGRADGPGVTFVPMPDYTGPLQLVARWPSLCARAAEVAGEDGAFLLRVPGQIASLLWRRLRKRGHPYALEVVGDPGQVAQSGVVPLPLRFPARQVWERALRAQCRGATAAAYVTERVLQAKYPPGPGTTTFHFAEVHLPPEAYVLAPRSFGSAAPRKLVVVGSLAQLYKGPDVLLRAMARLGHEGLALELCWIGEGRYRPAMESLSRSLGLEGRASFVGHVAPGDALRRHLDAGEVFVLPSRTEGLPRALLEAMARGLPCVASAVGGVPELLDQDDLARPGDAHDLATTLRLMCSSPAVAERAASRNLLRARQYSNEARAEILQRFLLAVRAAGATSQTRGR